MRRGWICIVAKPPRPGTVKTRLIPAVGAVRATELAQSFLADTLAKVEALDWAKPVLATTDPAAEELDAVEAAAGTQVLRIDQGTGDLGARLETILSQALREAPWAMVMGADSPAVDPSALDAARRALDTAEAVLCPSEDGGFYLLGVRACPPGLLADLPWSAANTAAATRAQLEARGWRVAMGPPAFDVDVPEDLVRLRAVLAAHPERAPRTARVLADTRG